MVHEDFTGRFTTTKDGVIGISRRNWIESKDDFQRPITVEAEMRTDGRTECITMSLFARNNGKNTEVSLEIGGWGTKWRFFPGDNRGEMGSVTNWRKVKLELDSSDGVNFFIDGDLKYSTTSSRNEGKLRFIAGCQSMKIRNVKIGKHTNLLFKTIPIVEIFSGI